MKTKNQYVPNEEALQYFHNLNDRDLSLWLLRFFRDKNASPLSLSMFHNSRSDVMHEYYTKMRKIGDDELCNRVEEAVAEMFLQYPANENNLIKDHPPYSGGFVRNMIRFMFDINLLGANRYVITKVFNYAYEGYLIPLDDKLVVSGKDNHLFLLRLISSLNSFPDEDKIKLLNKYASHHKYGELCRNVLNEKFKG